VVPLQTTGVKNLVSSYRYISKHCALPKLFEAILAKHLSFVLKNILSPFQHGFLIGWSTSTNLLEWSYCFRCCSVCFQTVIFFTDFRKAFDKVYHLLLLLRLSKSGFPDLLVNWISS